MGVSKNKGTPKWMVYNGKPENPIKMDNLGVFPYFWKHPSLIDFNPHSKQQNFKPRISESTALNPLTSLGGSCQLLSDSYPRRLVSPLSRVVGPLPNCLNGLYIWGLITNHLRPSWEPILRVQGFQISSKIFGPSGKLR